MLAATETDQDADRYKQLRAAALALFKWGTGAADPVLQKIGADFMESIVEIGKSVIQKPHPALVPRLEAIKKKYNKTSTSW